ncbi:MAG: NYN domain-containing protein [Anaerolineae bacterium]|jgi:hypothetical protein|nr:NYN domain-containing protein [Anaerolineae bacterium]MDX9830456.1 NYN domain-containing protein [Anaerolineae bacterium]
MQQGLAAVDGHSVPQAMFRQPQALQSALDEARLAPQQVALWARQAGDARELEKLAGWLSVGQRPDDHRPLLAVAAGHLRAGELLEALPVFRWAYLAWQRGSGDHPARAYDGAKILALWGECLHRLGAPRQALERWLWALAVVPDAETLARLVRTVERNGDGEAYQTMVQEARRRDLPGAAALPQHLREAQAAGGASEGAPRDGALQATDPAPRTPTRNRAALPADPAPSVTGSHLAPAGVAVMADVSNLDLVCRDQYGPGRRLDYGRLLACARHHGPLRAQIAFVPDMFETLAVRRELARAGFEIDLKQPKVSHGRLEANADTAMAAAAVRWASDPAVSRVELWTGDGDFVKVREVVANAWPRVAVTFRSFEVGTAWAIRRLGRDWMRIGPEYLWA